MGTVNVGAQVALYRYQTPLVGADLAQVESSVLYPGIYSGLVASLNAGGVINVSSGSCLIHDSASYGGSASKLVKITFGSAFTVTCSIGHKFVVIDYMWYDDTSHYADIYSTDDVHPHHVVLCALEWSGAAVSVVDTASSTQGYRAKFDLLVKNLEPLVDYSNARRVNIAAGRFIYGSNSLVYAGGNTGTSIAAVATTARWDLISLTYAGAIHVITGTEGGSYPALEAALPVCFVHVRPGVTNFLQSDIVDIRPFLTFAGVLPASASFVDLSGLSNLSEAGVSMQSLIAWMNTKFFDGSSVNALSVQGKTPSTAALTSSPSLLPTSSAVMTYVNSTADAARAAAQAASLPVADATYVSAVAKVAFLLLKDVGQVAFFAGSTSVAMLAKGWLRCDGQVISGTSQPKYMDLVNHLKATPGFNNSHPYYNYNADDGNTVTLPDLKDRYPKDVGISGRKLGSTVAGDVLSHTHAVGGGTGNSGEAAPSGHTHGMAHSHPIGGNSDNAVGTISVAGSAQAHGHVGSQPNHKHSYNDTHHANHNYRTARNGNGDWNDGLTSNVGNEGHALLTSRPVNRGDAGEQPDTPTLPITVVDCAVLSVTGTAADHQHGLPAATGLTLKTNTDLATPDSHSHTVTVGLIGTGPSNEVNNTALAAYIFYGYPS